jgi:N-acetylmuramoyl-L-alanine amidase/LysM domain
MDTAKVLKRLARARGGLLVCAGVNRRLWPIRVVQSAMTRAAFWLVLWAVALPVALSASEDAYVVKRGDTIFSIAHHYGIAPSALAERNGLERNYHIYAGQRLLVPGTKSAAPAASKSNATPHNAAHSALPRSVQQAIDRAPVKPGRWKYIVVHHSGTEMGTVKGMDQYHREVRHMEHGLAYDFVIGNGNGMADGEIAVGNRWTQQLDGGHLASEAQNKIALGICLVGNFDEHLPTAKEMASLRALVEALMVRCQLTPKAVKTHQQINIIHTRCPGSRFPTNAFLASLHGPAH